MVDDHNCSSNYHTLKAASKAALGHSVHKSRVEDAQEAVLADIFIRELVLTRAELGYRRTLFRFESSDDEVRYDLLHTLARVAGSNSQLGVFRFELDTSDLVRCRLAITITDDLV